MSIMGKIVESESRIKLLDLECLENENVPVEILHVDSPTSMWIRPTELKSLFVENTISMMEHYKDNNRGVLVADEDLVAGTLCAVRASMTVRRGNIIYVDDSGYAEIWLLDLGYSDFCYKSKIYYLESEFREIPVTAIHCGLSDVQPSDLEWTCSAQRYITDTSLGIIATASICTKVVENSSLWLKLNIRGNDIGSDLIMEGDALLHRQRLRNRA